MLPGPDGAALRMVQARAVMAYSAALAECESLDDVIDVVATMVLPTVGASGLLVSLVYSHPLTLAGHTGYQPEMLARFAVLGVDDDGKKAWVFLPLTWWSATTGWR